MACQSKLADPRRPRGSDGVRVRLIKGRLGAAQKDELGAKLIQAVSDVEGLANNGRIPGWEGLRAGLAPVT